VQSAYQIGERGEEGVNFDNKKIAANADRYGAVPKKK